MSIQNAPHFLIFTGTKDKKLGLCPLIFDSENGSLRTRKLMEESTMSNQDAVRKYQEKCDQITLRPPKNIGQIIRTAAKNHGQSVQKYVLETVLARIENEKTD